MRNLHQNLINKPAIDTDKVKAFKYYSIKLKDKDMLNSSFSDQ